MVSLEKSHKIIAKTRSKKRRTYGGFEKWEWFEMIIEILFIVAVLAICIFLCANFLGEGLQLIKYLNFGG